MQVEVKHTFDNKTYRHSLNGQEFVLHCHHYMGLTTKMAEDFADLGGVRVLYEATEDSMRGVFDKYIKEQNVESAENRLAIGAEDPEVLNARGSAGYL